MAFLCVDVGATNTLIGVGNGDFEIVQMVKSKDFLEDIGSCLEGNLSAEKIESIDRVAVAAAGPIDRDEGVFYPPNIPIDEVQIGDPLEEFGDVSIVNDCTSAVIGEYFYGDHDCENLVYVTISTGIGAGVVVDGNVIEGWNGNFGEVGHMQVAENGLECGCGCYGHWEAYCSGNNLPRLAKHLTGESFHDARELFDMADEEDKAAMETLEQMREMNARAFANLVDLYNPGKIVLGGAVALNHPGKVVDPLETDLEDKVVNRIPSIEKCSLEEEAVLHGLRAVCNGEMEE
ncbi:MAG: ROK family protein [Candidatus Nanohaloarchaea archaeon]